jgi:hypothetical protein
MTTQSFYAPPYKVRPWIGVVCSVALVILSFATLPMHGVQNILLGSLYLYLAGVLLLAFKNRRRAVLELSENAITYGPIGALRRRHIPVSDVAGITANRRYSIRLARHSARPLTIRLWTIAKDQRQAAREAIERRFAARGA